MAVGQAAAKTPHPRRHTELHRPKLVVLEFVDVKPNGRDFPDKKIQRLHEHEPPLATSMNAMSAPVPCHPCILISRCINAPHAGQVCKHERTVHRHWFHATSKGMPCASNARPLPERHAWTAPRSNSAASSVLLKVASAAVVSRDLRRCRLGKGPQPSFP